MMVLITVPARNLNVPLYELLGGQVRHKCQVYCWIGGDRPSDIEAAACVYFVNTTTITPMDISYGH